MLRKYAGHKSIAMGIWQKGLQCILLSRCRDDSCIKQPQILAEDLRVMIQFFGSVGSAVNKRRETPAYEEAVCTAGSYRQSGLTQEDHGRKRARLDIFRI